MANKILYIGAHGTGKSTAALAKAAEIKTSDRKLSVKVIEENVREIQRISKVDINTPSFQKLCFVDHLHKELLFDNLYDILICDRTCLDTLVYGLAAGIKLPPEYFSLAIRHLDTFSEIYFYRPKDRSKPLTDDGFRDLDLKFRDEVDSMFESVLKLWGGQYTEIRN